MTDEWTYRTTTGTATAADGELRVSASLCRTVHATLREGWERNDTGHKLLFVASVFSSVGFLSRVVTSAQAVLAGRADALSVFVLAVVGLAVLAVAYRTTRTRTVRLREVETVRRVDGDQLRVEREGDSDHLEIGTPTESDTDEAVEILRLRGVPVEQGSESASESGPGSGSGSNATESPGFRERLRAKDD